MKYIVALLSSIFIFIVIWFLIALLFLIVFPTEWQKYEISIGCLTANLPSIIGLFVSCFAAQHTFKASLHAKTGKLYRKKKSKKNEQPSAKKNEPAD